MGGLVCATLLARAGLRVLLAEQHYMVGGYCSTFKRGGYTFDAATHFYPLLGNPATITGGLLEELGIRTRWIKMDPVDHFHFPDGSQFSVPADFDEYYTKLVHEFPDERAALDRFFVTARDAYLSGLLFYFKGRTHARFESMRSVTLREVLDRSFANEKLRLLLSADCPHWGSPPSRTSFVFDSMLRLSYFLGNFYPEGGSQAFVDDLAGRFEELGGHILLRARVNRILVEHDRATGVDIEWGSPTHRRRVQVTAGHVVSNADLLLTARDLLGAERVGHAYLRALETLVPSMPCYLTHLGLRGVPLEPLRRASGYHWRSWDAERLATDVFKIFVPTDYEPRMAPRDCHIVVLQKVTKVDYEGIRDWRAHKREIEADLLVRLEAVVPGLGSHADVCLTASAQTARRYTLNHQGAMLGWEMSPTQLGDARPAVEGPIANLFNVGHWTRPGGGITPVIVSAMHVAKAVTRS